MPTILELVPVSLNSICFLPHTIFLCRKATSLSTTIYSFLHFLIYIFFFQGTYISIPWYRVSFWRDLNLSPLVPFANCLAQAASLNSVISSESVALHFISNHRNTLFLCSSFWIAPLSIKSSCSFLETTERFHANMQKDICSYFGI